MQEVSQFHYPLGTITPCQPCIKHQASSIKHQAPGISKTFWLDQRQIISTNVCCFVVHRSMDGKMEGKMEEGGVRNTAQYNNK